MYARRAITSDGTSAPPRCAQTPGPTVTQTPTPTATTSRTPSATVARSRTPTPTVTPSLGDINGDGVIDAGDIASLIAAIFDDPPASRTDLNDDGLVTAADIDALLQLIP